MSYLVDHLREFIKSTWKWCTLFAWIFPLMSVPATDLDGSSLKTNHLNIIGKKKNHHLAFVAAMDPIDISSSDSDWDLEDDTGEDTSHARGSTPVNFRILPTWAAVPGTNAGISGYGEQPQRESSPKRLAAFSQRSSNVDDTLHTVPWNDRHYGGNGRGVNGQLSQRDDPSYSKISVRGNQPSNFVDVENLDDFPNLNDLDTSGENLGKVLSQQDSKRILPPSLQPSLFRAKSNKLVENVGTSQIRDAYEKSLHNAGTSSANERSFVKNYFSHGNDDEITVLDNTGSRVLPQSLFYGSSASSLQLPGPSDPLYRSGGEEVVAEHDERPVLQAALQDLNQPKVEATMPVGLLSVPLLRHQKIALHWMLQKETKSTHCCGGILADDQGLGKTISMIALIQMHRSSQSKFKEDDQCSHKTEALNLDDDDDDNGDKPEPSGASDGIKAAKEVVTSLQTFCRRRPAAGTLVVCPASVLRQWARELDEKVTVEAKLSVLIYHGGNRTKDPVQLAKYDVVLTTYSIVTNEVPKQPLVNEEDVDQRDVASYGLCSEFSDNKKRKKMSTGSKRGKKGRKEIDASSFDCGSGTLAKVGWFRVILDEAQTIKNHRTLVARACCGLRAKRRWCLSGTPIQNAIDDLYSYFRFLKVDPYYRYKSFCNAIKNPISRNSVRGYLKLRAILTPLMLRRTKDTIIDSQPIVNLPPKTTHMKKVDFSAEERAFYMKLEAESRSKFKAYAAAGTVKQNYANILLMLLRLRQACDHPLLVQGFNSDSVGKVSVEMAKRLPKDMLVNLLNLLETSLAICCVCSDPPEDAVVTLCGHVFCHQCVSEYVTGEDNMCPAPKCKEQLGADVIFSRSTLKSCITDNPGSNSMDSSQCAENALVLQNEYGSSKIRAVLEILLSNSDIESSNSGQQTSTNCNGDFLSPDGVAANNAISEGPIKAIIFSQWTRMLDLVEISLNQFCIQYRRLDGTMTLASRDRNVKDFNTDPEVTVMLMSLKAGNLGLNMVAASRVILLDLWWNPTTEDQAVDRTHRIGQTRCVNVSKITIKNTVEDRILALQEEKRKMVASAFGEDQGGGSKARLTVQDLNFLFMADR